jgi:L-fuconolactonase
MKIDAHQHCWRTARNDYGWLTPALAPLYRDFMPTDLVPLLKRCGVEKTILVQAAPTEAETEFLLALARETEFVAGVVGWVDFTARDVIDQITRLAKDPLLVGLRPMVQDITDDDWLLRADLKPAFRALVAHDLVFDALVRPRHLSRLLVVLDRNPELTVVVDHAAKPEIRLNRFVPWGADIAAIGARPNTACKLSGLVTEASPTWTQSDLKPVVEHVLGVFGPNRILWGSDWPVVTMAVSYERWYETALALTADCSQQETIFGGNAARIYLSTRGRRNG